MKVALSFGFCLVSIFSFGQYNDGAESLPDVREHNIEVLAVSTTTEDFQTRLGAQVQLNMLLSERVFVSIGGHFAPHYIGSRWLNTMTSQSARWENLTITGVGVQVGVGAKYSLSDNISVRWTCGARVGRWLYSGTYFSSGPYHYTEDERSDWESLYIRPEASLDFNFKIKKDSPWSIVVGGTSGYSATLLFSSYTTNNFLPNAYIGASYTL